MDKHRPQALSLRSMPGRYDDAEADRYVGRYGSLPGSNRELALRVYTSHLLGGDPSLVLHGGGNTSVKTTLPDDLGEPTRVLCIKASGWDLGRLEPAGLPAIRLEPLAALRRLDDMDDETLLSAQRVRMLDASAPNPSVESLLHAFLPHAYIDHSHADAILALADQEQAESICREVFGDRFPRVPYIKPGFGLAKRAAEIAEAHPQAEGLILLRHGLVTFGASAREAYERHVRAVDDARAYLGVHSATPRPTGSIPPALPYATVAPVLRGHLQAEGRRYVLEERQSDTIDRLLAHPDLRSLVEQGPITPDHVIRIKPRPLLLDTAGLEDTAALATHLDERLEAFRGAYRAYLERQRGRTGRHVPEVDADPRVILAPGLGVIAAGPTARDARIAADIYEHTAGVILAAEGVGAYRTLGEDDLFDMEFWSLEQAKLGQDDGAPLRGRVVYVTGAASGIGRAVAQRFAAHGASLYLVDRDAEGLAALAGELGCAWQALDLTDEAAVRESIRGAVERFGGLDGVVSNAGTAPRGRMDELPTPALEDSLRINLLAHQWVAAAAAQVLRAQQSGGFLLFNASKAAFNPGAEFGPYAIPKAALVALMKQYALEGGPDGIRANAINADRIRTGLFPDEMVQERARARGVTPDEYFRSNLLKREVTAEDVADAFLSLALAESTTGAVLTVDGGNIAASPR